MYIIYFYFVWEHYSSHFNNFREVIEKKLKLKLEFSIIFFFHNFLVTYNLKSKIYEKKSLSKSTIYLRFISKNKALLHP